MVVSLGEHTVNGDHSDAHQSTFSHSSKEVSETSSSLSISLSNIYVRTTVQLDIE